MLCETHSWAHQGTLGASRCEACGLWDIPRHLYEPADDRAIDGVSLAILGPVVGEERREPAHTREAHVPASIADFPTEEERETTVALSRRAASPRVAVRIAGRMYVLDRDGAEGLSQRLRRLMVIASAAAAMLLTAPVSAQCPERPDHLTLAILTWHEAGVDALDDAAAIHASIDTLSRIRGETWAETACAYSGRALRGETRRAWLAALDGTETEPAGWPDGASWSVQRRLWGRLLDWCATVVAGYAPPACDHDPTDWGDPDLDSHRIERGIARRYWYRVDCIGARNVYLRRHEADEEDR